MKRRLTEGQFSDRIRLSLKFIEVKPEELNELIVVPEQPAMSAYWIYSEPRKPADRLTSYGLWDSAELDLLKQHPETPTWSPPPLSLVSGCEARYSLGGRIPVQRTADDGTVDACDVDYGRTVVATATITDFNRIHLAVASEIVDLSTSHGIASAANCRRIDATFEMDHGETRVFSRKVVSSSGRETFQLMLATAWLKPFEIPVDPETIPVSAVDDLSSVQQDIAKFRAEPERAALLPLHTESSGDSKMARQQRRLQEHRIADQVQLTVEVSEMAIEQIAFESRRRRISYFGYYNYYDRDHLPSSIHWNMATDVFAIDAVADPCFFRSQGTDFEANSAYVRRFCDQSRIERWQRHGFSRRWRMPAVLADSGKELQWHSGGNFPTLKIDEHRREILQNEEFGATITATATTTDQDRARVDLDIRLNDLVNTKGNLRVGSRRRLQSTVRIASGETVYVGQPTVSDTGQESFVCFRLEASIVPLESGSILHDDAITSALFPANSDALRESQPRQNSPAKPDWVPERRAAWAATMAFQIPRQAEIDRILKAADYGVFAEPNAELLRLSYRLANPFAEDTELLSNDEMTEIYWHRDKMRTLWERLF